MILPKTVCLGLALWAASADAFFAYCPSWNADCDGAAVGAKLDAKVERDGGVRPGVITFELGQREDAIPPNPLSEASRLTKKFSRSRVAPRDDNAYSISPAASPTSKHAIGIDQDGTDFSYFAQIRFGTSQKAMYMLTDTGAGTSWAMGAECSSTACGLHRSLGPADSDTLRLTKNEFAIGYSTGAVKGVVASDSIVLADALFLPSFQFGLATEVSDDFIHFPFDGILGLARNNGRTKALLASLKDAKALDANLFAFYLGRASDGPNVGELSFGALNPAKYEGDITYTPLADRDGDWIIPMDSLSYGDDVAVDSLPAYMDTGTTYMFGPPDAVRKFHTAVPGADTADNITWTVPCDAKHAPVAAFSGVKFEIDPKDWLSPPNNGVCTSNIYGIEVLEGSWLIGGTFLKNVYSVFDDDNARIGFAKKVIPDAAAASLLPTPTPGSSRAGAPAPTTLGAEGGHDTGILRGDAARMPGAVMAVVVGVVGGVLMI